MEKVCAEATASASLQNDRLDLARFGESLIAARLQSLGFEIVDRNVRVGRLEIDIIARRGSLIVVCEVRTRRSDRWGTPAETINKTKLERLRRASAQWLRAHKLGRTRLRIDVAAVTVGADATTPTVHYYENASYPMRHVR